MMPKARSSHLPDIRHPKARTVQTGACLDPYSCAHLQSTLEGLNLRGEAHWWTNCSQESTAPVSSRSARKAISNPWFDSKPTLGIREGHHVPARGQ